MLHFQCDKATGFKNQGERHGDPHRTGAQDVKDVLPQAGEVVHCVKRLMCEPKDLGIDSRNTESDIVVYLSVTPILSQKDGRQGRDLWVLT